MQFDNLKKLRESLDLNQKEFAETIGVNKTTYNNYESGIREPRADFFKTIADKYNTTIDFLLGLTDNPCCSSVNVSLSVVESKLIDTFRSVNAEGQEKIADYVDDIIQSGKYKKHNSDCVGEEENRKLA